MRSRKITLWVMVMVLMVFCLGLPEAKAIVVFNDGVSHVLNRLLDDTVWVLNSPSGEPTKFYLARGGAIGGYLSVYDSSQANISGGLICVYLDAYNSSQVSISAVEIGTSLTAYDSSQVSISGGSIGTYLYAYNYSKVNITGGSIGYDLDARGASQINISDGLIGAGLFAYESSQVNIIGGRVIGTGSGALYALGNSQINIYGSDFNYPYGPLIGSGILTGTLANGDSINNRFEIYPDAKIVLVPEPTHILTIDVDPNDVGIDTITPSVGAHDYAGRVNINAQQFAKCPDVYQFDHWEGDVNDPNSANTTVFMDTDKTVTAVFVDGRKCGDECHPYPIGDLDKDCVVTFGDFALFASHWLECTKPECD